EDNEERGWLATIRPRARAAGHGLATCKGVVDCSQGPLQGQPPTRVATYRAVPTRTSGRLPWADLRTR
ncbi:hypothetical protein BHM03_00061083, partial [Ensete ventricosum]